MLKEPPMHSNPDSHPRVAARARSARPYDPVSSLLAIRRNPSVAHHKLDWNESTIPPSPEVFRALQRFLANGNNIHWYPDPCDEELLEKIKIYTSCRTENILVSNGSDEALSLACQTYLDSGDEVVAPFPTYRHFLQFAELAGARIRLIRKDDPFSVSLRDVESGISSRTKIVYLANPNNPTGILLEPAQISRMANRHLQVLFLVDEAYYEFSGFSCSRFLKNTPNMMITRSFSKCFGLAGLRLGYVIAPTGIIRDLLRVHNPKSTNIMAQVAAAAALGDLDYYHDYVDEVRRASSMIKDFCDDHGILCRLTRANFILITTDHPEWIVEKLRNAGVHVRNRSSQLPGMIRLTVGTSKQMEDVLLRLKAVIKGERSPTEVPVTIGSGPAKPRQGDRLGCNRSLA
jgi:histidinol-phosphate aminotransferase